MLQNNSDRSLVFYLVLFSFVGAFMTSAVIVAISALMPNHAESSWSLRITILLQDLLVLFLPAYLFFLGTLQEIFAVDHVFKPTGEIV